ncbi:MAG: tetratricopeptide repeat protein [Chloroflexi bacterium]|nr:tetratricopeptide repeat protein [Chloroflexota bacterium]
MARNRRVFEEAVRSGASAAWDGNWQLAIESYERALTEFPQDVGVLTSLGLAHFESGHFRPALKYYQQASELSRQDPVLFERIGRTQEQLGQRREAAESYHTSAECYIRQQQAPHLALERWQDAVRADPGNQKAHAHLLQYYQRRGQIKEAVQESLTLARILKRRGQRERAAEMCRHALRLAPHDPEAQAVLDSVLHDEVPAEVEVTTEGVADVGADLLDAVKQAETSVTSSVVNAGLANEHGSLMATIVRRTLADLAESVFDEGSSLVTDQSSAADKTEIGAHLGRAIDHQTRGRVNDSIDAYEELLATGFEHPGVHFNLGLLYQSRLQFAAAIAQLERVAWHREYSLGTYFALGECFRGQGALDEALRHFLEVLKMLDLSVVRREQADDLVRLYDGLADSYLVENEQERLLEFINLLVDFLSQDGWEDRVVQARRRLDALVNDIGPVISLAEMLTVPNSEGILESIAMAQGYAEQGQFYAALEECYQALGNAPTYMPIHRQLVRILNDMGKVEEAAAKIVAIADSYRVRGQTHQAIAMYSQALSLAPVNASVRTKLIDLLISYGYIDDALEHYVKLAESYYHMAQMDRAREIYQEALPLAPRSDRSSQWQTEILHLIADIDMQRVDFKSAMRIYEQIRKVDPSNERARLVLMELYERFGHRDLFVAELNALTDMYRKGEDKQRMFAILEEAVRKYEDDIPLRIQAAQAYLDAGVVDKALKHLDKLGDLQLEGGRIDDARKTVRVIIALNPPNVEDYRLLLQHLD